MLVLYLFLSLLAFQIEQFEDECAQCGACKTCAPCQLCPDSCQPCYGLPANITGCEPCAACLHCALCSTCTECYKCFTTPVAVDPTAADTQQRAMSIQSVTSWPHGGRMAGSSVSSVPPRRRVVLAGWLQLSGVAAGFLLVSLARHRIYGESQRNAARSGDYVATTHALSQTPEVGYPEEAGHHQL